MTETGVQVANRRRLPRAVLVASSVLVTVAALEVAARARWTAPWYQRLLAEQAANQELAYTENRWGLRDRDYETPKPAGTLRVLVLGDSFTHGTGVADDAAVFSELLERRLNERTFEGAPRGVEVLNGGISGSLTRNWVRLWHEVAGEFDPDVLLVVFFLRDGTLLGSAYFFDDIRDEIAERDERSWLYGRSYLYRTLRDLQVRKRVSESYTQGFEWAYFGTDVQTKEWKRARKNLALLRDESRERGTRVGLAVFPVLVRLGGDYPFQRVVDLIAGYGRELGVPTHDMLPSFLGRDAPELWVSPADQHPNAAGHAIAAESLYPFVVELLEGDA